ncbi:MAG: acetamidase/formamidase family protein [Tissierellia bacterium]|nr:acetamidase/formamidase family protein [Tissierellia bacterium]
MKLDKTNLVYAMSKDNEVAMRIDSLDEIVVETCDCFTETVKTESDLISNLDWTKINPATGPIFVNGAEPGDVLKVDILEIEVEKQGVMISAPGLGLMGDEHKKELTKVVPIEGDKAIFNESIKIDLNPMIGVIGVAPKDEAIPTGTPFDHGGNMDCKKIKAGNTLYLPVNVEGALLALGDLHAAMADGEVNGTGVEISGKVKLRVEVLKDFKYQTPLIESDEKLITVCSRETMKESSICATKMMQEIVIDKTGLSAEEAGMLLSLVGDLKVAQVVDPNMTMRMEVAKKYLK